MFDHDVYCLDQLSKCFLGVDVKTMPRVWRAIEDFDAAHTNVFLSPLA